MKVFKVIGDMPVVWFIDIGIVVFVLGLIALMFNNILVLQAIPPIFFSYCIMCGIYSYRKASKKA